MSRQIFEFDPHKAATNLKKHGVSFREAMTVFDDPLAQTFPDDLHSEDEDRSITIGLSSVQRLLFLSHRETEDRIRLIGARPANSAERKAYEDLKAHS
ncbi:MAG: BrnT family toxin [Acidobacteriota bacterium]|nr:BrnT family toxin [Acidobacteriota bacterium]